ncbi:hypothetical protein QQF64_015556 [Cirrhinus molitorella]|uniref:Uncharacterized protein n=1 Tax=Cirrhinus molitorella TaxID=172907 RepID=A0ABR3NWJ8_9TELE
MAFASSPLLLAELSKWCKEVEIEEAHAILLIGVPATTEVSCIEDAVQMVKALWRVRVRDLTVGPSPGTLLILCKCREVIDPAVFQLNYCFLRVKSHGRW